VVKLIVEIPDYPVFVTFSENYLHTMNLAKKLFKLSGTGFTNSQYYESMNMALKRLNNGYTMLHYPFFVNESDSFTKAQANLTDYCISLLDSIENKEVVEIGCGNGVQSLYIFQKFNPARITGIDLSKANIDIALSEKERLKAEKVTFFVDDAQDMKSIPSESVDVLINIESAFHYPDKTAFIKEVHRVLKPGGQFLIADILSKREKRKIKIWGKSMSHHFWNHRQYYEEFIKSDLEIFRSEDISDQIRKGWSLYKNWLPKIKRESFIQNVAFRIFYVLNSRINLYLLKKQQYHVFTGFKRAA
jgi:ubiquinone/menaquinone biosynthesis C-methylase UbiE